ncbi:hypothetical protein DUI87_05511 [Hirundo rustica rustica]|uniref:Uncharacterized protein n=1 Tax=Hirundo rustica rustica TaxID=333673 RepID=A0A3M0L265_HIRRU|nr:hypothetical protein DUI87_05511 [Hirundo rustica rustica]
MCRIIMEETACGEVPNLTSYMALNTSDTSVLLDYLWYLMGAYKKDGEGLWTRAWSDSPRGNGFPLPGNRTRWDMGEKNLPCEGGNGLGETPTTRIKLSEKGTIGQPIIPPIHSVTSSRVLTPPHRDNCDHVNQFCYFVDQEWGSDICGTKMNWIINEKVKMERTKITPKTYTEPFNILHVMKIDPVGEAKTQKNSRSIFFQM